jgi:hypothetical protein
MHGDLVAEPSVDRPVEPGVGIGWGQGHRRGYLCS